VARLWKKQHRTQPQLVERGPFIVAAATVRRVSVIPSSIPRTKVRGIGCTVQYMEEIDMLSEWVVLVERGTRHPRTPCRYTSMHNMYSTSKYKYSAVQYCTVQYASSRDKKRQGIADGDGKG
jgi:hypothetical protein